jgi:hypothetical protein
MIRYTYICACIQAYIQHTYTQTYIHFSSSSLLLLLLFLGLALAVQFNIEDEVRLLGTIDSQLAV